jgi:hypothetical protein
MAVHDNINLILKRVKWSLVFIPIRALTHPKLCDRRNLAHSHS